MRNAAFLALALALLLLQANVHRVIGPAHLHGWTPSLALPLVIFLGVHEPSMARGALLAFVIGHALDLFASAPIGLFTFLYVSLWWLARIVGVRLTAQTVPTQMALTFGFALVEALVVLVLLVVFGADPQRPVELATVVVPHSTATALIAPLVFRIAERLHQTAAAPQQRQAEAARP
jgi:rod shape-determining protein MreD